MMTPAEVARQALCRLGRGPVLIPGFVNRLFVRFLRWMPRRIGVRLAGHGIRGTMALPEPGSVSIE